MASMARSGETLLLKILGVHEKVAIVHNIDAVDNQDKERAFQYLKQYKDDRISRLDPIVKPYSLKKGQILLLKQGVWQHKHPFNGFILSRNPISIYSSLKSYDKKMPEYDPIENFWFNNNERLLRWSKDMDEGLFNSLKGKEPIEQFVTFYNYRMGYLAQLNKSIIRFEDLVNDTEKTIVKVCDIIGIPFSPSLLQSHNFYEKGLIGHGQNDLSKPIDKSVLEKYKLNVAEDEFDYIVNNTSEVSSKFGYEFKNREVIVR